MSQKSSTGSTKRSGARLSSAKDGPSPPLAGNEPGARSFIWARAALVVAFGVALYLSYVSFTGEGVAGCGAEGGCSEVLNSRWSKWLGIPVSLPAAGLYLILIALSFPAGRQSNPGAFGSPALWLRVGAWTVVGAALWFLILSAFVLGKFCPYCLTVHLLGSTGAFLLLHGLTAGRGEKGTPIARSKIGLADAPWALLPLGFLIGGQLGFAPKTSRVTGVATLSSTPSISTSTVAKVPPPVLSAVSAPVPSVVESKTAPVSAPPSLSPVVPIPVAAPVAAAKSADPRFLMLHGERFKLDLNQLPVLGNPGALKALVSQFDYTCEHCRRSHGPISQAQQYFSNELAVISLPMPLDGRCNEWIRRSNTSHNNGCQLAALALGVWRADRTKFREFDHWMMTSPDGLKTPLALARARSLVGEAKLDQAIADPWVANTLQLSIALYRENWQAIKNSSMPMLVVGTNIVSGTVSSATEMFRLLDQSLGLKQNP